MVFLALMSRALVFPARSRFGAGVPMRLAPPWLPRPSTPPAGKGKDGDRERGGEMDGEERERHAALLDVWSGAAAHFACSYTAVRWAGLTWERPAARGVPRLAAG